MGTPVVASNVAALREVLGDGAKYFELEDKRELKKKMIQFEKDRNTHISKRDLAIKLEDFRWEVAAMQIKKKLVI